jgi:hypothetical protein
MISSPVRGLAPKLVLVNITTQQPHIAATPVDLLLLLHQKLQHHCTRVLSVLLNSGYFTEMA